MTGATIIESARNNLNALTDTLWSEAELLQALYRFMLRVARECSCIEEDYTTTTVAAQAEYTIPTRASILKRVTYDGKKLTPIDRRQFDAMNATNSTSSGTPGYYIEEDSVITLYPTPDDALTLKVCSLDEPDVPTTSSTLEIPSRYHDVLVDGLTFEMCPKDLGHPLTLYWEKKADRGIAGIMAHVAKRKRGDKFAVVKTEEQMNSGEFGII